MGIPEGAPPLEEEGALPGVTGALKGAPRIEAGVGAAELGAEPPEPGAAPFPREGLPAETEAGVCSGGLGGGLA